jgi:hypothetical protein
MIAMKMAYKDMIDFAEPDTILPELHLGTFAAVD